MNTLANGYFATHDLARLGRMLRTGEVTATELVEQSIKTIEEMNPTLNAFVSIDAEARRAAQRAHAELAEGVDRGPLHGIPVGVKDLVDIEGLPTTAGSASSFGATATEDAEVVRRLREAGAVIVGKTTLHEFAYGATGDRSVHGASRNPADPSRMSGGSSGGSAVAVAAGMVPLAIGTDTAGSVRVPAALCGIVGLKPTYDAISSKGVSPLAPSLDHVGLFATTVAGVRIGYEALTERPMDGRGSGFEVGWIPPGDIAVTDPRIERLTRGLLDRSGLAVEVVHGFSRTQSWFEVFSALQGFEAFRVHEHHLDRDRDVIDPEVLARLDAGRQVSAARHAEAEEARRELRAMVGELLRVYDVLVLPTVPIVAPAVGERNVRVAGHDLEVRSALLSLTSPWNLTGLPAVSVPAGHVDNLPVGIQLLAASERTLFAAAMAL
ncbi:amidase [Amycolatopsis sp.]|uniref:amidase n=1 Tax=Amycolatopsis sp. TaxID=37632 RepID=UPI002CA68385|nr:amidase [Amycolatopsis sp.]HVV08431.1 amidase [Amycolatopsis sp.]